MKITDADYGRVAADLGCEVAAVRAVADVEARGSGFVDFQGHTVPAILFERHVFLRRLRRHEGDEFAERIAREHPQICSTRSGGYWGGPQEHERLTAATKIHRPAGLESASYGLFQIMGYHWNVLGYSGLQAFINAMWLGGEKGHLDAFVRYVRAHGLQDAIAARDWTTFARAYNGAGYARLGYHTKMRRAYEKYHKEVL